MSKNYMFDFGGVKMVSEWQSVIYPLVDRYMNKMCIFFDLEALFYDLAKDVRFYIGDEKIQLLRFLRLLSNILMDYCRKEKEVGGELVFFCFEPEEAYIKETIRS